MLRSSPRIVSLIPSATEIVALLGMTDRLVGRSHECDYPFSVKALPICTEPKFNPEGSSAEIHGRVTDLADVWADIEQVAAALNVSAAEQLATLKQRVQACAAIAQATGDRPTVACIEWSDPLMAAGNWIPELVELAGGRSLFGIVGQHSPWLQWDKLVEANPETMVFMPCGYNLQRTRQDAELLSHHPQWLSLKAVQTGQVYITDGNQYFNRPGQRLVDSLEILAEILHPQSFLPIHQGTGWEPLEH